MRDWIDCVIDACLLIAVAFCTFVWGFSTGNNFGEKREFLRELME